MTTLEFARETVTVTVSEEMQEQHPDMSLEDIAREIIFSAPAFDHVTDVDGLELIEVRREP